MGKVNQQLKIKKIIDAISLNGGFYDDHLPEATAFRSDAKYVLYIDSTGIHHVCPVIVGAKYCCLNPIYIDSKDGKPHLSRGSVGGVVKGCDISTYEFPEGSFEVLVWLGNGELHPVA